MECDDNVDSSRGSNDTSGRGGGQKGDGDEYSLELSVATAIKAELKAQLKAELKVELKTELKDELKDEIMSELLFDCMSVGALDANRGDDSSVSSSSFAGADGFNHLAIDAVQNNESANELCIMGVDDNGIALALDAQIGHDDSAVPSNSETAKKNLQHEAEAVEEVEAKENQKVEDIEEDDNVDLLSHLADYEGNHNGELRVRLSATQKKNKKRREQKQRKEKESHCWNYFGRKIDFFVTGGLVLMAFCNIMLGLGQGSSSTFAGSSAVTSKSSPEADRNVNGRAPILLPSPVPAIAASATKRKLESLSPNGIIHSVGGTSIFEILQGSDSLAFAATAVTPYSPDWTLRKCVQVDPVEAANVFSGVDDSQTLEECCERHFDVGDCLLSSFDGPTLFPTINTVDLANFDDSEYDLDDDVAREEAFLVDYTHMDGYCDRIDNRCPDFFAKYCNFDGSDFGFCEPCPVARFNDGDVSCAVGLPIKGKDDCTQRCTCSNDDDKCKCDALTRACGVSLMKTNKTDFCQAAEDTCNTYNDDFKCGFWQSLCQDYPGQADFCAEKELTACCDENDAECKCGIMEHLCHDSDTKRFCPLVPESCCPVKNPNQYSNKIAGDWCNKCNEYDLYDLRGDKYEDPNCACDFYGYAEDKLRYQDDNKIDACVFADSVVPSERDDIQTLYSLYNSFNGDHWLNKWNFTHWLNKWHFANDPDADPHCDWSGITCNTNGFIIGIDLAGSNLTGTFDELTILLSFDLEYLNLANNSISGSFGGNYFFSLKKLKRIDIAENNFSGNINILAFPAADNLNFSHNNFDSVKLFRQFSPAYEGLRVIDLSGNQIKQDITQIFSGMPVNLVELSLADNKVTGNLPETLPTFESMRRLAMGNNNITGTLPDFPRYMPRLRELILSNQDENSGGLTGSIPAGLSNLADLVVLNLAGNSLTQKIPADIGNFLLLKELDLSFNSLNDSIPTELGKLGGVLEVFNLSNNNLENKIPSELGQLGNAKVLLRGNKKLVDEDLVPLALCSLLGFDLKEDKLQCPPERNALKEFYTAAMGTEWTKKNIWLDEYKSHCLWFGVECDMNKKTIKLKLDANGLSGTLSKELAKLQSLQVLDLSDNDMKGKIPIEIGRLSALNHLRLNHNSFIGNDTNFGNLENLKLIQLHGNRLSGTIPILGLDFPNRSSYVTDCGYPSDFETALKCTECTMCCNVHGDCYPQEMSNIQMVGFASYVQLSGAIFGCLIGFSCLLALAVFIYTTYKNSHVSVGLSGLSRALMSAKEEAFALKTIGEDSVYKFILLRSIFGWFLVFTVAFAQIGMLFIFVRGAEIDLSSEKIDLTFTWKCSRDQNECAYVSDLNWIGWLAFGFLMAVHLLKDAINGIKLILLSANGENNWITRARYFVGGMILISVTVFTLYASTIYNYATATTNTGIIENSVIILFIMDMDEMVYSVLVVLRYDWVVDMAHQGEEEPGMDANRCEKQDEEDGLGMPPQQQSLHYQNLVGEFQTLQIDFQRLQKVVDKMQEQSDASKQHIPMAQDDGEDLTCA